MNPQFPLYIVSKGRWESRLTAKALDRLGVPFRMVVEEQEFAQYAAVIDPIRLLILDKQYQRDFDPLDGLGDAKSKGSGPARNFAWAHALGLGFSHHWVMDDNIRRFRRLHKNAKVSVGDGTIFRAMEDFCLRYENVGMAGPDYTMFAFSAKSSRIKPFCPNTRIYSCNLIRNDVPFRWRGRYNEDTILSLDMLDAGWCTILFKAFLQEKLRTLTMKGGNTDEIYKGGTLAKSQLLVDVHPQWARIVYKYGRPHHHVNYAPFAHLKLRLKPGLVIPREPNDYGMRIVRADGQAT